MKKNNTVVTDQGIEVYTNKKRDLPAHLGVVKKGQGQRIINNRKKGGETYAET